MTATFLDRDVWTRITKAVRANSHRCDVAVAYFGVDACTLLPLSDGCRLVVDASEHAVASGQTCPEGLLKLVKRGVKVYSRENLHAKVFAIGRTAYIGSANASYRSARYLAEAVVRVTDTHTVQAARSFVRENCLEELGPEWLAHLATLYRPPHVGGGGRNGAARAARRKGSPVVLAQLREVRWSDEEQAAYDAALPTAKRNREHPRTFALDSFIWERKPICQRGDLVVQVTAGVDGKTRVAPAGKVVHLRTRRAGPGHITVVFVERPARRRRQLKDLARVIGCSQARLRRSGMVQSARLRNAILGAWADPR